MNQQSKIQNSNSKILIVEDSEMQAVILKRILVNNGYKVYWAKDGREGLEMALRQKPALVMSDILMPVMDGFQLCREIKEHEMLKDIPVLLLTQLTEPEEVIRGLESGSDSYITKPFHTDHLLSKVESLIKNPDQFKNSPQKKCIEFDYEGKQYTVHSGRAQTLHFLITTYENAVLQNKELAKTQIELKTLNEHLDEKVKERTLALTSEIAERKQAVEKLNQSYEKLRRTLEETAISLSSALEMRDAYTAGHQRRVTQLACAIAREMRLSDKQFDGIRIAGILHDIGKISVPADILSKPGKLSKAEFELIKVHANAGYEILKDIEFPWPIAQIVLQHHEKMDGSGYPAGLSGDKISIESKIICVADVVEAIASHRPYRAALGIDAALEEIIQKRGILYDSAVVDTCVRLFKKKGFRFE